MMEGLCHLRVGPSRWYGPLPRSGEKATFPKGEQRKAAGLRLRSVFSHDSRAAEQLWRLGFLVCEGLHGVRSSSSRLWRTGTKESAR